MELAVIEIIIICRLLMLQLTNTKGDPAQSDQLVHHTIRKCVPNPEVRVLITKLSTTFSTQFETTVSYLFGQYDRQF